MKKRKYDANWLSNVSVALVIVGGFQQEMPLGVRLLALFGATITFLIGRKLASKGDDK